MIKRAVTRLVNTQIRLGTIQESDRNVYEYGYQLMIEAFINVVISLLLGAVLGCFKEVVFFLIVFMPLRSFCGGYHAAKTWQCTVLSNLVVLLVIVVSKVSLLSGIITPVYILGDIVIGGMIVLFAPVDNENRRLGEKERRRYKMTASVIMSVEALLCIILCVSSFRTYSDIILTSHTIQLCSLLISTRETE